MTGAALSDTTTLITVGVGSSADIDRVESDICGLPAIRCADQRRAIPGCVGVTGSRDCKRARPGYPRNLVWDGIDDQCVDGTGLSARTATRGIVGPGRLQSLTRGNGCRPGAGDQCARRNTWVGVNAATQPRVVAAGVRTGRVRGVGSNPGTGL